MTPGVRWWTYFTADSPLGPRMGANFFMGSLLIGTALLGWLVAWATS